MIKKYIHIFDDDKFIDPAIKLFEEVIPEQSVYYIIQSKNTEFRYVKSSNVAKVDLSIIKEKNELLDFINSDTNHVVFIHALNYEKQQLIFGILPDIKKVWFIWGYDLYGSWPLLKQNIYLPVTKSILEIKTNFKTRLIYNSFSFFLFHKRKIIKRINKKMFTVLNNAFDTSFYKTAKLVDFIAPVVPAEYRIIKNMNLKAEYVPFTYGCIEDLLGSNIDKNVMHQPNILVGNSADPSNNHLDIFLKLSDLDLRDRKIYVPLSYSGNDKYKEQVLRKGYELFGDKFCPLTQFMPLDEYNEILLSCGTLVFSHIRQQGVGNIIVSAYLGARIFLNEKSPVYEYYRSEGLKVFPTRELSKKLNVSLKEKELQGNREKIFNLYNREAAHEKIKKLIQIVEK
ncbi:TDP-N-acetylfucosamine:lipid II N-acetylfucosaminyltransferase [Flavobacterium sp. H122]|uniref:TDP-N-acetylfucosamine:lipid II N-acetylfucosaminyltransferase n=1 Tax=Flavobacterium sp. H122 TaxID=2529860 RepID=UPI0010AB2A1A|nr:TDP-N-acetylfucosamine:lipid II N-acetylfucosaminyltransferase [Flavobacterium sp. H122]